MVQLPSICENGFVGDLTEAINSDNTINFSSPVILDNLTLGPDWWDTFKVELVEASLVFQRKNISNKQYQFHKLQRDFFRLPGGSPAKEMISTQLRTLLREITKEFNFQKAKDKRLTHEQYSSNFFKQASADRKSGTLTELKGFNEEILTNRRDIQDHLLLQYFYLYQRACSTEQFRFIS